MKKRIWMALFAVTALGVAQARVGRSQDEPAHFHHVHMNVVDPQETIEFYSKVLGATHVKYKGVTDALFTERSFIFMNQVDSPPAEQLKTALYHIGWGGVDGPKEYEWWKSQGVEFTTPATALGNNHYMYFDGPDGEMVEIYTGERNHRFNHLHIIATDVNVTTQWYADNLGLKPRRRTVPRPTGEPGTRRSLWSNAVRCDNVSLVIFGAPRTEAERPGWYPEVASITDLEPTEGTHFDHIAFSYRDIEPVFERMKSSGVEIVKPIAEDPGYMIKSFFVRAPDDMLVEIIEAKPLPEAAWE